MSKFEDFLKDEINEIEKHKWIESEKANMDLSFIAEIEWISKFAAIFRQEWEEKYGSIIEDKNGMCCSGC